MYCTYSNMYIYMNTSTHVRYTIVVHILFENKERCQCGLNLAFWNATVLYFLHSVTATATMLNQVPNPPCTVT
jgi:hypothetical protein